MTSIRTDMSVVLDVSAIRKYFDSFDWLAYHYITMSFELSRMSIFALFSLRRKSDSGSRRSRSMGLGSGHFGRYGYGYRATWREASGLCFWEFGRLLSMSNEISERMSIILVSSRNVVRAN